MSTEPHPPHPGGDSATIINREEPGNREVNQLSQSPTALRERAGSARHLPGSLQKMDGEGKDSQGMRAGREAQEWRLGGRRLVRVGVGAHAGGLAVQLRHVGPVL